METIKIITPVTPTSAYCPRKEHLLRKGRTACHKNLMKQYVYITALSTLT